VTPAAAPRTGTIDVAGGKLWFTVRGEGPPLFHVHGSGFGHANFSQLTPWLVDRFTVVDFDLPGFGRSSVAGPPREIHGWADDVSALIRALGYDRAHVHGTSMGGLVALSLAARHGEVVDRLTLSCMLARYDAAARAMRATWKAAARASGMAAVAELTAVAGFSRAFFERPDSGRQIAEMGRAFSATPPEAFIAATEAIERLDLEPLLADVHCPVLLLAGDQDAMTPATPARSGAGFTTMAAALPDAELVVLADCGHYLVIEQPRAAAHEVARFLLAPR
jgi:3-oxoadipate enol-lactonase